MVKPKIAPEKVFQQADCFYQALAVLRALQPAVVTSLSLHTALTLTEPVIVLSALTTELFLKCLICIETDDTPHTHDLEKLYGKLSAPTRTRIEKRWDTGIAIGRSEKWDDNERFGLKMPRDLPSALAKGSDAFERLRYSYEENTEGLNYYLEDLPALLERLILEMKPEFEVFRRMPLPSPAPRH
jgi:hypothetical protein